LSREATKLPAAQALFGESILEKIETYVQNVWNLSNSTTSTKIVETMHLEISVVDL